LGHAEAASMTVPERRVPCCDLIAIGASAGGVQALTGLARSLPADLAAAVVVVLHLPSGGHSVLGAILDRAGPLAARAARDGDRLEPGCIYVAPPDHHTIVADGSLQLIVGPKENGHRPSIDPLFRSAAQSYGSRLAAVVLSGMLDDGTAGLLDVKRAGGVALVQDPDEAQHASMARSAIEHVDVDHVGTLAVIARILGELAGTGACEPTSGEVTMQDDPGGPLEIEEVRERFGPPSGFTCPECGGAIWEIVDGNLVRYRCHVGHAYTLESFLAAQTEDVEAAIWSAIRALREKATMSRRMERRMADRQLSGAAARMRATALECDRYAAVLEDTLGPQTLDPGIDADGEVA
jgi:two-component system, chemotaxis family, protein-glutamate methylesterase/glutaminase